MIRVALTLAILAASGRADAATILARCGPSSGQSYYFEAGAIGPGRGGWQRDGFESGRVTIYIDDKEQLDILVKDSTGLRSYLKEGYKVGLVTFSETGGSFLVSAYGPKFSETYLVKLNEFGVGTLAWTASKITPLVVRTSIMTAECGPRYAIEP